MLRDEKWWYVIPITSRTKYLYGSYTDRMDSLIEEYYQPPDYQDQADITIDINDLGGDADQQDSLHSEDRDLEYETSEEASSLYSLNIFIYLLDNENENSCINIFDDNLHDPYTLIDSVAENVSGIYNIFSYRGYTFV